MARQKGIKPVASNRRARHDYFVEETYECGLALHGTEVKSIRQGRVNLKESFARIKDGEAFVESMHISPYEQGNVFNVDPLRPKKLLLHKAPAAAVSEGRPCQAGTGCMYGQTPTRHARCCCRARNGTHRTACRTHTINRLTASVIHTGAYWFRRGHEERDKRAEDPGLVKTGNL